MKLASVLLLFAFASAAHAGKPNVLFVISDDLNTALKDCAKDVRKIIKGLLFTKVLEELKSSEKKQLWKTIASAATSGPVKIERITREIEVIRADMTQLSAINQVSQTFHARLLLVMRMPDGAKDKDLVKEYDGFPLDSNGRKTCNCLELHNSASLLPKPCAADVNPCRSRASALPGSIHTPPR